MMICNECGREFDFSDISGFCCEGCKNRYYERYENQERMRRKEQEEAQFREEQRWREQEEYERQEEFRKEQERLAKEKVDAELDRNEIVKAQNDKVNLQNAITKDLAIYSEESITKAENIYDKALQLLDYFIKKNPNYTKKNVQFDYLSCFLTKIGADLDSVDRFFYEKSQKIRNYAVNYLKSDSKFYSICFDISTKDENELKQYVHSIIGYAEDIPWFTDWDKDCIEIYEEVFYNAYVPQISFLFDYCSSEECNKEIKKFILKSIAMESGKCKDDFCSFITPIIEKENVFGGVLQDFDPAKICFINKLYDNFVEPELSVVQTCLDSFFSSITVISEKVSKNIELLIALQVKLFESFWKSSLSEEETRVMIISYLCNKSGIDDVLCEQIISNKDKLLENAEEAFEQYKAEKEKREKEQRKRDEEEVLKREKEYLQKKEEEERRAREEEERRKIEEERRAREEEERRKIEEERRRKEEENKKLNDSLLSYWHKDEFVPVFVDDTNLNVSSFFMCDHQVTQSEYKSIIGKNPSNNNVCDNNPVENVSWYDAIEYCNKLSKKEGLSLYYTIHKPFFCKRNHEKWIISINNNANGYRLPTIDEWCYAAKGGIISRNYNYIGSDDIDKVAWIITNSKGSTHPVKQKQPNELGIYDMAGNVWELTDSHAITEEGKKEIGELIQKIDFVYIAGGSFSDNGLYFQKEWTNKEKKSKSMYCGFRVVKSVNK